MKKINRNLFLAGTIIFLTACSDFLNVVPDDIATIEHAFTTRYRSEEYLYGCYSFLPLHANPNINPAFLAGDEIWLFDGIATDALQTRMWNIARGQQNTSSPIANYWGSKQEENVNLNGGTHVFTGLRDCNIFLENIHIPQDMGEIERQQWIAEVKFLKAYYHFWLMKLYGPIPIIRENLPISSTPDEVKIFRDPVEDVAEYIVELLDEAAPDLPLMHANIDYLGRATRPVALALKAQVLTWMASPLFNGSADTPPLFADFTDQRGVHLFPTEYKAEKWQRAAESLKEAIEVCHEAGHELFDFSTVGGTNLLQPVTVYSMGARGAATERWNPEIIWGEAPRDPNPTLLQRCCMPTFNDYHQSGVLLPVFAPTLRVVEQFYSSNGVPIEEDVNWQNTEWYGRRTSRLADRNVMLTSFETLNLHFDREPRFYGSVAFDGGLYFGNGSTRESEMAPLLFKYGAIGRFHINRHSATGYLAKKMVSRLTSLGAQATDATWNRYAFPIIRLADLYLMYAEALNETKTLPDDEVYEYIDFVRMRSGLKGVVESWRDYSIEPNKPASKEGMRDIIRRERLNELAFEGIRFWDMRRWRLSEEYMNQPIYGLNKMGETADEFYVKTLLYTPSFNTKRDYLWPLRQGEIMKNGNLIQNPGW